MSKKRPSSKKRAAAGRKSAASRSSKPRPKTASAAKRKPKELTGPTRIELKPLRGQIAMTIEQIARVTPSGRTKVTMERLQRCIAEFDAICDPLDPDGCGPSMDFPLQ